MLQAAQRKDRFPVPFAEELATHRGLGIRLMLDGLIPAIVRRFTETAMLQM
jgi:hypothetical protein